jgi:hypothetical protein
MAIDWTKILSKTDDFLDSDTGKLTTSALAGLLQKIGSKRAGKAGQDFLQEEGREQKESGIKLYEKMLEELRSGKFDVAQEQRDASEDAKIAAEEFVEATRRRGQEGRGDLVSAIQSGDPRMSGLVPQQAREIEQNLQRANLLGLDKRAAANAVIADLEQSALDKQAALSEKLMDRGALGAEAGRQMELAAMLQAAQAGPASTEAGLNTGIAAYSALTDPKVGVGLGDGNNTSMDGVLELLNQINPDQEEEEVPNNEQGGVLNFEDGGGMTNGEFSHENNPKAIIDEDTGLKEGEVTGGELVFNVDQTDTIEELVESGEGGKLVEFLRNLLSKKQFQK